MNILAIETTGAYASVAVINHNGNMFERCSRENLNHLQFLMPMIKEVLERADLKGEELDFIAVSEGPGSFTGVRIGVASARALAQAWNKPCISVPTLETFVYNAEIEGVYCPIFDARRGQIYGGAYKRENKQIIEIVTCGAYMLEEFLEMLIKAVPQGSITFFGDGIKPYKEKITLWRKEKDLLNTVFEYAPDKVRFQTAASVLMLGERLAERGESVSYRELLPNYMRKPEAERKLHEKLDNTRG